MSSRAKVAFIGSLVFSAATVFAVHYSQEIERDNMFQGVIKDQQRVQLKKEQKDRLLDYERQLVRREELTNLQNRSPN